MRTASALALLLSLGAASGVMAQGSTKQDNSGSGASQYAPGQREFKGTDGPGASAKAPGQQDFKDNETPGASENAPGQQMRQEKESNKKR